jgi:hypothetical protein
LDFQSLYESLEEKALDYRYLSGISNMFQKIRDRMHLEQKPDEEAKAQWEMDVFNFTIESNVAKPMFTGTNDKGEQISYPSYDRFNDQTYEYITKRLGATENPLLKARYAHIMWLSPKKHGKFAIIAIDAYIKLIRLYEDNDKKQPTEHYGLDIVEAIKNALNLANNVGEDSKLEVIKQETKRLIFDFNMASDSLFALRANLIGLMLDNSRIFAVKDFDGLNELCLKYSKDLKDSHKSITMLELGGKIELKIGVSTANWKLLIAEHYEGMMNAHIQGNKLVAIHFCELALRYYREVNEQKKIDELEGIYNRLKDEAELKEVKVEIDLSKYVQKCKEIAGKIVTHSSEEIIAFLISETPKLSEIEKVAEEVNKNTIQRVIPHVMLDERGHVVQHFNTEKEIEFYETLQQYSISLENQYAVLMNTIILEAIKEKKLDFTSTINFFAQHSWFGKKLNRKIQNKDVAYDWLSLIAPSVEEYFSQMDYLLSTGNHPNFVLCFDSLILKIEGLLRDLCNYSGITTFVQRTDKQGRIAYREKDLNALLHDEKMKTLMGDDDLFLLKFVLVEKAGLNLRHRTAHSLLFFWEYGLYYMNLLFLLLLKIGKLDFMKKEKSN